MLSVMHFAVCSIMLVAALPLAAVSVDGETTSDSGGSTLDDTDTLLPLDPGFDVAYLEEVCGWLRQEVGRLNESGVERDNLPNGTTPEHGGRCNPCTWLNRTAHGECSEHCTCTRAGRWHCCRMRKEFSEMSDEEAARYIKAYITMTTKQPYKTEYDTMVGKHTHLFEKKIHKWPQFWPWHRYLTVRMENLLRTVDCHVTLPYWDFTLSWKNLFKSKMWSKERLGGTGTRSSKHCVTDGPFAKGKWHVSPSAGGGCLKRDFDTDPSGISPRLMTLVMYILSTPDELHTYEKIVSVYAHSRIHMVIGGVMSTDASANEPAFWMLHSFADKLWGNWQQRGSNFKYLPFTKMSTRLSQMQPGDNFTVADMVDLGDLPPVGDDTKRFAICYNGYVDVETAYSEGRLHGLPVPRQYARNYAPFKDLKTLLRSIQKNRLERHQLEEMKSASTEEGMEDF